VKLSDVKPISYVKANAAAVLDKVAASREPLGITQHGEIKAVMVGAEEYQRTQDTLAFLKLVALGEEDIAQGNIRPVENFVQDMRNKLAGK
jgi:prevent-host-death family protein